MVSEGRVAGLGTAFAVRAPDSASSETLLDEDMGRIGSNDTSTVPGKSPIGKLLTYFHMVFDQINFRYLASACSCMKIPYFLSAHKARFCILFFGLGLLVKLVRSYEDYSYCKL
ncbi:hypothetical protein MPTK2_3g05540 [Marchantia polymorpha subsp. ruderalis]